MSTRPRFIAFVVTVIAVSGCVDNPQLPVAPNEVRFSTDAELNGVEESINGNADIMAPQGLRRMEIQARRSADGIVSGKWKISQEWEGGVTHESDVTCFTIVGNKVYVGGVLTATDGVPTAGYFATRLALVDNGEGKDAPDQASQFDALPDPNQPAFYCQNYVAQFPLYDLVRGNLQIRP